ncbi:hypothetical protein IGI04_033083 [Brassica rapa subsp. trilocularis]|uniref:RNase H type-1 domain-containing protein n=1 Tax=Brassica rapa subsp. trilocularis TaxID=1813537 RepID=A0ABQ7L886_BRACM|nr:hypothetical protein IGI04_033083 [Brassica rapa subsp. trilocularis]
MLNSQTCKVSTLFLPNSTDWDLRKIREICPDAEEQILQIKTSKKGAEDKLCWMGTKDDLRETWNLIRSKPCLPPTGISRCHLAPWIMWEVWTARNKLMFSNLILKTEDSLSRAIMMAREWQDGQVTTEKTKRMSRPHPQATFQTTLKTDAAWNATSRRAGMGWTLTQNDETASFAAIENNVSSPLLAEGLALREALLKICNRGIVSLSIQSDSKTLINRSPAPELYGVVADILCISAAFESVSFRWIPREENTNADLLAKQVLSVNEAFMAST